MSDFSPCLDCGACCSTFRVSFYWGESDSAPGGLVPDRLIEQVTPHLSCMQGTNQPQPRCVALMGEVGSGVRCSIYENRSSTCQWVTAGLLFFSVTAIFFRSAGWRPMGALIVPLSSRRLPMTTAS